ncbi:MAG: dynamin family protein [Vicinamibacterales bacterium]
MRVPMLDEPRRALLGDERRLLGDIARALAQLDVPMPGQEALRQSTAQLDGVFLLVIIGEFNAGKSALINALIGQRVLNEGVTPTTARVAVLRFGDLASHEPTPDGFDIITAPVELLETLNIVDTPGTNAILREHEALTREFVPRADLVLFVTSADRPFTESERVLLEAVRRWGKPVLIAVNKMDLLETVADRETLLEFVRTHAAALLGELPQVFALSARQGARARRRRRAGARGQRARATRAIHRDVSRRRGTVSIEAPEPARRRPTGHR